MDGILLFVIGVGWLMILVGCWLGWQLLRQNGRILLRLDDIEEQLHELEFGEAEGLAEGSSGEEAKENREKVVEHSLTFPIVLQQRWEISRKYAMFATPMRFGLMNWASLQTMSPSGRTRFSIFSTKPYRINALALPRDLRREPTFLFSNFFGLINREFVLGRAIVCRSSCASKTVYERARLSSGRAKLIALEQRINIGYFRR